MAVNGTIKINELALTAPIFDEAKKYIVFANDITTTGASASKHLTFVAVEVQCCWNI